MSQDRIATALARLTNLDLVRLVDSAERTPKLTPGLLAYVEYIGEWEEFRRAGHGSSLPGPGDAISEGERAAAMIALGSLIRSLPTRRYERVAEVLWCIAEDLGAATVTAVH
jgi:hypothetical protein